MDDVTRWALIVGFVSPLLLRYVMNARWAGGVKAGIAFGWAVISGGVTAWLTGQLAGISVVSSILIVLVAAIASYEGFWKQLGATNRNAEPTPSGRYSERRAAREAAKRAEEAR